MKNKVLGVSFQPSGGSWQILRFMDFRIGVLRKVFSFISRVSTVIFSFFIFHFLLFTVHCSAQSDSLSLNQAIFIAHENALGQKKVQTDYQVAKLKEDYLMAGLKPQLRAGANLPNFYRTTSAITQPDGTIGFMPISQDNSSLNLNLSQTVLKTNTTFFAETRMRRYEDFTGDGMRNFNSVPFRIGIEQAINRFNPLKWDKRIFALEHEIARANLSINTEKVSTEVSSAYFDLLAAQINQQIAETNAKNNEKIYEIAQERDKLGKISKSDFLQLELSLNSSRQNTVNAKRELIRANAALRKVMGWEMGNDNIFVLREPDFIKEMHLDAHATSEKAWQKRPEEKTLRKLLLESERALEQARKDHGWGGTLSATLGWVGTGPAFSESYRIPQQENFVQVSLSIPIFDGGQRRISTRSALEQKKYVEQENEFTEQAFKQDVRQLVNQFNEVQEEVKLGGKSLTLAKERYEIANQRYILNDISITDLGIAYSERDNAWRNYINLLRGYWVTYYTLRLLTLEDI